MANNRMLRDYRDSDRVNNLSPEAEVFFIRCFMEADDYGVLKAHPSLLKSTLYPLKLDYTTEQVIGWMKECINQSLLTHYIISYKSYIQIVNFGQKVKYPKKLHPWPGDSSGDDSPEFSYIHEVEDRNRNKKKNDEVEVYTPLVKEVIDFLNLTCGSQYKTNSQKTIAVITARAREKFTFPDFQKVILHKHQTWGRDPKMSEYLRPETLFGNKFEGYLQSAGMIVVPKSKMDAVNASAQDLLNSIQHGQ